MKNFSSCMRSPGNSLTWWHSTPFAYNAFLMNGYKYVTVFSTVRYRSLMSK